MSANNRRRTLIIARTALEAREYATAHELKDWSFVVHPSDIIGANPATHEAVFTGEWRWRAGIGAIRSRARDQGFDVPN